MPRVGFHHSEATKERLRQGWAKRKMTPERFWSEVEKSDGCWLWRSAHTRRYGQVTVGGVSYSAHRYAWMTTYGPIPDGMLVCHHCDTTNCVRPEHLFIGTQHDNVQDMLSKGRGAPARGEKAGNARLTEVQVREIRRLHHYGVRPASLGRVTGVSEATIRHIVKGHTWQTTPD